MPVLSTAAPPPRLPACVVCGAGDWSPHQSRTRLRACRSCGTFLNDRSASRSEEEGIYHDGSAAVTQASQPVAAAQFETMLRLVQARQTVGKSVLDIGCGRGEFMATAREQGWRTAGLEIDPVSARASQSRDLDVRVGSIFDTELPPGPWTVITLWDVLDHLENPLGALRLAITELAPGGILIARGRNAALHAPLKVSYATLRPIAESFGVCDLSVVHRWGIRPQGWARLLGEAGLENVTLHPAAPTPGDRYGSLGPAHIGGLTKRAAAASLAGIYNLSLKKIYPFTSVLVCGSR